MEHESSNIEENCENDYTKSDSLFGEGVSGTSQSLLAVLQLFFNICVMGVATAYYIHIILSDTPYAYQITAQIVLSIFRMIWNEFELFVCDKLFESGSLNIYISWSLFIGNRILPCIVTVVSDPSCLLELLVGQDYTTSVYWSYSHVMITNTYITTTFETE
mmetsp:Transcript_17053/g.25636  ORF Transcript_17053/g.25636 Transcript_17053/m.25636 type:complete len:161 (-) Transcript_17053:861-1343(-)